MNQALSPTFSVSSKYLDVYQDQTCCLSDRSHLSDRPPSSAVSIPSLNLFNFQSKKHRKIQKFTPSHSQSYYRRFRGQSRFGRLLSTKYRFSSGDKKRGNITKRSESARKIRDDLFSENNTSRTFQVIQEKFAIDSKTKLPSPKQSGRSSLKQQKAAKETKKSLMKKLKTQLITLIPQKNVSPASISAFTLEFCHILNETDFSASGMINYSKFCIILSKLKFLNSPFKKSEEETQLLLKAWKILGGYHDSFVLSTEVHLFSLFLVNVFFRLDSSLPNSPQNKKKIFINMKVKELAKLRLDFSRFYLNRSEAKATRDSVACTEEVPDCLESVQSTSVVQDSIERFDTMPDGLFNSELVNRKIVRKVSIKDLAAMNKSGVTAWQTTIDSTKNISSCNESEEFVADQLVFPLKDNISITKVQIKRYSTRIDELNKSHVDLNESVRSSFKGKLDLTFTDRQELRTGSSALTVKLGKN